MGQFYGGSILLLRVPSSVLTQVAWEESGGFPWTRSPFWSRGIWQATRRHWKTWCSAESRGVQRPISLQYQIYPPSSPNIWYFSNWNASPRSWSGWKEMQICKYWRKFWEISVKKWPSRLGEIGGAGGETGGRESEGRSDQVKFFKLFQNGRIWSSYMTESNSVELFNVEFFLTEKLILKVEIPLFEGFVHPSDFPKSGGDPV